jgi:hypothetical protein
MEPAVRVELTTNGLQIRCSATELRRQILSPTNLSVGKRNGELCEYRLRSQYVEFNIFVGALIL